MKTRGEQVEPLVSVVVPMYNRAQLIERALRSVLEQSLSDLELIVVDDGSTDDSCARVEALADPRVVLCRAPHSGRPAVARNLGLERARGRYVAWLDSDDVWLADKLALQVRLLEQRPDAAMVYGLARWVRGERELGVCGPTFSHVPERIFELLLLHGNFIPLSSVVVRREVVERMGGFDEDVRYAAVEDFELWLRVAREHAVLFAPRVVALYHLHSGSLSRDRRAMVGKVRAVIAASCDRFDVPQAQRQRALSRWWIEAFKAELLEEGPADAARLALDEALAADPRCTVARVALRLLDGGMLRPMRLAYRNRHWWTSLRARWLQHRWLG